MDVLAFANLPDGRQELVTAKNRIKSLVKNNNEIPALAGMKRKRIE